MGRAMARVLLGQGHRVTVWNRTPQRAAEVVEHGAILAGSAAEAVAASPATILSLTDYRAMYDVLGTTGDVLAGRVMINLSSDTPTATREAADWIAKRGGTLLAGGIMVPAPAIGTSSSYVFYSGPHEVFTSMEPMLSRIGRADYVGIDPALAQVHYQAQLALFLTGLSGYLQAAAMLDAAGVPPDCYRPYALEAIALIGVMLDEKVDTELARRHYPGELSTATMMGATAAHIVDTAREAGIDDVLPLAIRSHYERAVAAGHGADNWTTLWEVVRRPG